MRYDFCSVIIRLGLEVSSNFIEKLRMNKLTISFKAKTIYDNAQSRVMDMQTITHSYIYQAFNKVPEDTSIKLTVNLVRLLKAPSNFYQSFRLVF